MLNWHFALSEASAGGFTHKDTATGYKTAAAAAAVGINVAMFVWWITELLILKFFHETSQITHLDAEAYSQIQPYVV